MIIEITFATAGGINLGLERSWRLIETLIKKYPHAVWRKVINTKRGIGKYIVKIT